MAIKYSMPWATLNWIDYDVSEDPKGILPTLKDCDCDRDLSLYMPLTLQEAMLTDVRSGELTGTLSALSAD